MVKRNTLRKTDETTDNTASHDAQHTQQEDQAQWPRVVRSEKSDTPHRKGPALGEILVERKTVTEEQLR